MNAEEIKYRNEIKYICTEQQLRLIEQRIRPICKSDAHVNANGTYTVRSVYFDDYGDSCYYENESGVNHREKFRIRIYDGDVSYITLECKNKLNGKNHKFSCRLTGEQCQSILQGTYELEEGAPSLLQKLFAESRTRQMRPKVIVEYERTPFVYEAGNVRITFDRNISGSGKVLDFMNQNIHAFPVMERGQHILEVKYDEFLPDFIKSQMQIGNLQQTAFSKYYICRKMSKRFYI